MALAQEAQLVENSDTLQEVIVTAERRANDVQTTAIAITALSQEQLQDLHVENISDLQTAVPSFTVSDSGGVYNFINIRGIGNGATTPSIPTGIAVYRDGLLMSETVGQDIPMFDIQDTEILRGPQGTFVGAASTGGAVLINSADPNFKGINGYADFNFGNYSEERFEGAINLPYSDTLALRLAFNGENRGSFSFNEGGQLIPGSNTNPVHDPGKVDNRDMRVGVLWKPSDAFQALFKVELNHLSNDGEPGQINPYTYTSLFSSGNTSANPLCAAGTGGQLVCPVPGVVSHAPYYSSYSGSPYVLNYYRTDTTFDQTEDRGTLELRWALPDGLTIRTLTGFSTFYDIHIVNSSWDAANAGVTYAETGPRDNYYSEEINVLSPTEGPLTWVAGALYYYRDTPLYIDTLTVNPPNLASTQPTTQLKLGWQAKERTDGVFGQLNYQFTSALQLQVGVRENWDNNFNDNDPAKGNGVYLVTPPIKVATITQAGSQSDSVPTWKVDLNWTPLPEQFLYAFWARGYKSGGVNPGALDHPTFDPEKVDDFELGWKGSFFQKHLQAQLGGYYMDYKNMEYPIYDITNPAGSNEVLNLQPSKIKGLELSVQSQLAGFGTSAGLSYSDSSLGAVTALPSYALPVNFNSIPHPQCGAAPTAGCFNYTPYLVTLTGESLPFSPKLTANVVVDYSIHVGNSILKPRATFAYTDKQYGSLFQNNSFWLMGSRRLWGADLDWLMGPWLAEIYGTNLSNQTYIVANQGNPVYYGAPRQFGGRISRSF